MVKIGNEFKHELFIVSKNLSKSLEIVYQNLNVLLQTIIALKISPSSSNNFQKASSSAPKSFSTCSSV